MSFCLVEQQFSKLEMHYYAYISYEICCPLLMNLICVFQKPSTGMRQVSICQRWEFVSHLIFQGNEFCLPCASVIILCCHEKYLQQIFEQKMYFQDTLYKPKSFSLLKCSGVIQISQILFLILSLQMCLISCCCCLLLAIGKSVNSVLSETYLVLIPTNEKTKLKRY